MLVFFFFFCLFGLVFGGFFAWVFFVVVVFFFFVMVWFFIFLGKQSKESKSMSCGDTKETGQAGLKETDFWVSAVQPNPITEKSKELPTAWV